MKLQILVEWIKQAIIIIVLYSVVINAQNYKLNGTNDVLVDTSDYFPLQNGNLWDFISNNISGQDYLSWKVIGDTLMPNGLSYKYLLQKWNYTAAYEYYFRQDSIEIYQYYGDSIACLDREFKFLDFFLSDSSLWSICRDNGSGEGNARGIASTYLDYSYYNFLQRPIETKRFEDIYINGTDTLWTPGDGSIPMWFAKGIGPVRIFKFSDGDYWLKGALINGQQFGTLVSVEDEINIIPSTFKILAYPNPFNNTVNFNISLTENGMTEIYLFNILGEMVSTILSDYKSSGSYNIQFNADKLTSGIYLVVLRQGSNNTTQKIVLLK